MASNAEHPPGAVVSSPIRTRLSGCVVNTSKVSFEPEEVHLSPRSGLTLTPFDARTQSLSVGETMRKPEPTQRGDRSDNVSH
jgi:hypothetical protein